MRLKTLSVVLLALILAAMAMVPMVSAADDDHADAKKIDQIKENVISVETAKTHAEYAFAEFVSLGVLSDKQSWFGAIINPKPQEIYDVNGELFCYLFDIEKNNVKIGEIRIASSKVIGASVLYIGPQKNTINRNKLEKLLKSELNKYEVTEVSQPLLVSYAFPKIGLMTQIAEEKTIATKTIIVDAYDYSIITDDNLNEEQNRQIYSVYGMLDAEKDPGSVQTWTEYDTSIRSILKENPDIAITRENPLSETQVLAYNKQVQGTRAVTETETISGVPLYGQPNGVWCAVTTARMISAKYGVYRTADAIALKMSAYNSLGQPRMTSPDDELVYYHAAISSDGLGKPASANYNQITWDGAKKEIHNGRPFKVGDDGHSRAVTGYLRSPTYPYYTYLYFKNPAPINQGSEYWEWFNELNPFFYDGHIKVQQTLDI